MFVISRTSLSFLLSLVHPFPVTLSQVYLRPSHYLITLGLHSHRPLLTCSYSHPQPSFILTPHSCSIISQSRSTTFILLTLTPHSYFHPHHVYVSPFLSPNDLCPYPPSTTLITITPTSPYTHHCHTHTSPTLITVTPTSHLHSSPLSHLLSQLQGNT